SWVYGLKARYEAEGETALQPQSRRPKTSPTALATGVVDLIVGIRKDLADARLDAGPETIAWHLERHHGHRVSRSAISRHLTAAGLVTDEITTWLDDCTRYALQCSAHPRITTPIMVTIFREALTGYGYPVSHSHRQRHGLHRAFLPATQARAARTPSKPNSSASTSSKRTPGPATRRHRGQAEQSNRR
ncbi:MAG: helix-turn-helix domain-containing protein, partial [Microthrixaceae bacterium]|nr:helix-turn-helix domain-containing protein [Microthrixaceae bacterium]